MYVPLSSGWFGLRGYRETVYPVRLVGDRVVVREWNDGDADGLHRWLGDADVNRFLSWGTSHPNQSAVQLLSVLRAQRRQPRVEYFLAAELRSKPDRTIGGVGFTWIEDSVAEIGYFLEPEYWGRGLATESAGMVLALVFDLGGEVALATCDARNARSESVMKKLGMRKVPERDPQRLRYLIDEPAWNDRLRRGDG